MKIFYCLCGHKVADHRTYFSVNAGSWGDCSVPDCQCKNFVAKDIKAAA